MKFMLEEINVNPPGSLAGLGNGAPWNPLGRNHCPEVHVLSYPRVMGTQVCWDSGCHGLGQAYRVISGAFKTVGMVG